MKMAPGPCSAIMRRRSPWSPPHRFQHRGPNVSKTTPEHDERIRTMTVASVSPHHVAKAEKKERKVERNLKE